MQEVALAQGILDVVLDIAHGRQARSVRVRAGEMLAVSPDSLWVGTPGLARAMVVALCTFCSNRTYTIEKTKEFFCSEHAERPGSGRSRRWTDPGAAPPRRRSRPALRTLRRRRHLWPRL